MSDRPTSTTKPFSPEESARLREALQGHTVDEAAFAEAVQAKIAIAMESSNGSADEPTAQHDIDALPRSVASAASFFPFVVASGSLRIGASSASKWGLGSVIGALSLPIVIVPVLVLTFWLGLRGSRAARQNTAAEDELNAVRQWWRRHWILAVIISALFVIGVIAWDTTVIVYLMAGSMLAFGWTVMTFARYGLATTERIACIASMGLFYAWMVTRFSLRQASEGSLSTTPPGTASLILMTGAALCMVLPRSRTRGMRIAKRWCAALWIIVGLLNSGLLFGSTHITQQGCIAKCETFSRDIFSSAMWEEWAQSVEWLNEQGLAAHSPQAEVELAMELARDRRRDLPATADDVDAVLRWIRSGEASGLGVISNRDWLPSYDLGYAIRGGLLKNEHWSELLTINARRTKHLLKDDGPISSLGQRDWIIRALVQTGQLDDSQRDRLAGRLRNTWPEPNTTNCLIEAQRIAALSEVIDRPLAPAVYAPHAHAILRSAWRSDATHSPGGFASHPGSDSSDIDSTFAAILLAQRFGMPPDAAAHGINLYRTRSYLAHHAQTGLLDRSHWMDVQASIALQRLETDLGLPDRSLLETLLAEFHVIAAALLVGFAVATIWIARGAQHALHTADD